jgi:hypothetical protein
MEIAEKLQIEGERILSEMRSAGISLEITKNYTLRIKGKATPAQIKIIRRYKAQIIEALSPKCSNCTLALKLIEGGKLWFCPVGCQSKKA